MAIREQLLQRLSFLTIAASVVAGNWLHPWLEGVPVEDPFVARIAIAAAATVFFFLSFLPRLSHYTENGYQILYLLITGQGLYLSATNSLMHSYSFGMIIIITVVVTSSESRKFLNLYVPITLGGVLLASFVAETPRVSRAVYLAANGILLLSLLSLIRSKISLVESLREATEKEKAASAAKSEFLARMSHEIRTPMNGILPLIDLLRNTDNPKEKERYFDILSTSGNVLLRIINDILDLAKIEHQGIELKPAVTDIVSISRTAIELYRARAIAANLELRLDIDPKIGSAYIADAVRLSQVLNNFISNAIKFTERGSVVVALELLLEEQPNASQVRFTVRDTGIGIPQNAQARIFDSFAQAHTTAGSRYGGTGLGLTISKLLVELMGGKVSLRSPLTGEKDRPGTEFYFDLTLKKAVKPATHGRMDTSLSPDFAGKVALVVEDNPVNRLILVKSLEKLGLACNEAENGAEALNLAASRRYDVIFMDLEMPVLDGFGAARALRMPEQINRQTPIICITAHAFSEERARILGAGMDEVIVKPFSIGTVSEVLSHFFYVEKPAKDT